MSWGKTFPLWRAACPDAWRAYVAHPFVEGMGDGRLPRDAFLHYLKQDYVFLVHFSRAWALAASKADTIDAMRACAATLHALIDGEMKLHVGICAEAGISEAALFATVEETENLAYTRFVLDCGARGDFLDMLAALAPCVLGYGEIGARLSAERAADTPYADWIATYGGAEYQAVCADVGALIDGAVARRIGENPAASPRWPELCAIFRTATRLEAGFWDMGLRGGLPGDVRG